MNIKIEYSNFTPTQKLLFFIDALQMTHPLFKLKTLSEIKLTLTQQDPAKFQAKISTVNTQEIAFICASSHANADKACEALIEKSYKCLAA